MTTNYNPKVVTNGLVLCLDNENLKSYSGSGNSWNDLVLGTTFANANYSWANNVDALTIIVFLEKTGTSTGYASHPINKWNGGTGNASFVLYHFGNFQGNNDDGRFAWYYTAGATWTGKSVTKLSLNQKMFTAFQWNSTTGSQTWFNGNIATSRAGSGQLGVNGTSGVNISGPVSDSLTKINYCAFYNRDLSDQEVLQCYTALRGRYGI